ncbi:MAG: hypothetical protein GX654_13615 [Desulfatiglans sp.]|nr:hypothetical protein [Desulfatiglans sp.]
MNDNTSTPINVYDEMVKNLIKVDSPLIFGNISPEHAKFIITSFINSAKQSIEILSGSLCEPFYNGIDFYKYLKESSQKIKSPNKIRIITLSDVDYKAIQENFDTINKEIGCNVISYHPCKYVGDNPIQHFMVVDGKRYREEEPHQDFESNMPNNIKASVCCNGPEKAGELLTRFNIVWNSLNGISPVNA